MQKPFVGRKFGCSDQQEPINSTVQELSRVADLLYAAYQLGGKEMMVKAFALIDDGQKLEFNYSSWTYVD